MSDSTHRRIDGDRAKAEATANVLARLAHAGVTERVLTRAYAIRVTTTSRFS